MAKVLLVTDYSGYLHITPTGNKTYYESKNVVNRDRKYKLKEMEEADAHKFVTDNNGIDPTFTAPAQQTQIINTQQEELEKLREQLKSKDAEILKQQEQLKTLSTAPTSNSEYSKEAEKATTKSK